MTKTKPIDLTNPDHIRYMAENIANHVTDGTPRDLGDGNIERRNHANEFMKLQPDGSRIVDLEKLGIDLSSVGIDTSNPKWERQFNAEAFDALKPEDQQKIKNALADHIFESVQNPKTRFVIANEAGSKIYFLNPETNTQIAYNTNFPESSTAQNLSRNSNRAEKTFHSFVESGADEGIRKKFDTPFEKGKPVGIEGGISGAAEHYKNVVGHPPKITVSIDDLKKGSTALDLVDGAKEISALAKAGRLGANITGAGVVIGAASGLLMKEAHAAQRDLAGELKEAGILDEDAHRAYLELNNNTEAMLYGDLALSTADPTGLTIIVTAAVETEAYHDFKNWADEHAPGLSQAHFEALSMSMFTGAAARSEMLWEAKDHLPSTTAGQPEFLHRSIELNALYDNASKLGYSHKEGMIYDGNLSETVRAAKEMGIDVDVSRMNPAKTIRNLEDAVKQELVQELDTQFSNPEHTAQVLDLVPIDDRMEYVRRLAASDQNPAQMAQNHPEISAYIKAYDESWTGWGWTMDEDDPLKENPSLLNDYIMERTTPNGSQLTLPDPSQDNLSVSPAVMVSTLAITGPDAHLDITADELRLEATETYMRAAIPLENMRFGIANDPVEMRDMWNTFRDPQVGQSVIDLADKRFPQEMGELRLEAQERMRQQEFLKKYEYEQSMRPNAGIPVEMDPMQRMMRGPAMQMGMGAL